jgi:Rieske Fe-S protein
MPDQPAPPGPTGDATSRRTVLRGVVAAGALGVASPLLAACGGGGSSSSDSGSTSGGDPSAGGAGSELIATADVPVGGGTILTGPKVVVTQPTKDDFKAFTAVCTHLGCTVGSVSGGFIICPCHGSRYAITTGAPTPDSPAQAPLSPIDIKVNGNEIDLA